MPIDYKKYHPDWKKVIRPAILERAKNKCEKCGVANYAIGYRNGFVWNDIEQSMQGDQDAEDARMEGFKIIKIILTISHYDHDIDNNHYSNLRALCQKCHLNHDKHHHASTRRKKKNQISLNL